jgi:hypothetical protein
MNSGKTLKLSFLLRSFNRDQSNSINDQYSIADARATRLAVRYEEKFPKNVEVRGARHLVRGLGAWPCVLVVMGLAQ